MNIEKLREEIAADEGEVHEIYLDHLGLAYFWHWSSWFAMTIRKADYQSERQSITIESLKPSNQISKQSCQIATSYTQTLTICQKKLKGS